MKIVLHQCLRRFRLLALAIILLGIGEFANAQSNLLFNGSFESGNTAGWTTWGSALTANAGAARTESFGGLVTNRVFDWPTAVINA